MKRALIIALIAIGVVSLQINASANTVDLISNGDFSSGLSGWTTWGWGGGSVDANSGTLNWTRIIGTSNGAPNGAYQTLNADASGYDSLVFTFDVVATYQTLPAPGWWGGGLEYPAHVAIDYLDAANASRGFNYGFCYSTYQSVPLYGTVAGAVQGTLIPYNTWYTYTTGDLLSSLDGGVNRINSINLYGDGWDYAGSADNVQLLATTADIVPEPATMSLLGMGLLGLLKFRSKK